LYHAQPHRDDELLNNVAMNLAVNDPDHQRALRYADTLLFHARDTSVWNRSCTAAKKI